MKISKYFVRVRPGDYKKFTDYLSKNGIKNELLSTDIGHTKGSMMFSMRLNREEATLMKLTFDLAGFMNFTQTMDRQIKQRSI